MRRTSQERFQLFLTHLNSYWDSLSHIWIYLFQRRLLLPSGGSPPRGRLLARIHTRHRDTRDFKSSPLSLINVLGCCVVNISFGFIVVNQKLYLSEKK